MVHVLWKSVAVHTETQIQTQSMLLLEQLRDRDHASTLSRDEKKRRVSPAFSL